MAGGFAFASRFVTLFADCVVNPFASAEHSGVIINFAGPACSGSASLNAARFPLRTNRRQDRDGHRSRL
jgi:hypothetical protein